MSILPRMTGQERRQAIIEAAIQLFSERGFRSVTTRELASTVGVTEPVLYQHFPSKRDLYTAIIELKIEQTHALKERFQVLCQEPRSVDEFLQNLGLMMVEWHKADPTFMRLMLLSGLEDRELGQICHERMFSLYFPVLIATMARLAEVEGFRQVNPAIAIYAFLAALTHHCMERMMLWHPLSDISDEEMVRGVVEIFVNGLKKDN
jgi:AcrR family transcriptional regulator